MKKRIKHQPRCPHCGMRPLWFREVWNYSTILFAAEDGDGCPEPDGTLHAGSPDHVVAICLCEHEWRLRGISQITQVRELWHDAKTGGNQ